MGFAYWMRRVLEECQRAAADLAPDPVHDLRVALRRCRSLADGIMEVDPDSGWKDMKKAGKALFSSLGELRDLQVMSEWVEKLGPPDEPETRALLDLLAERESQQKLLAGKALRGFALQPWRKWSRELPRRAARVRRGSAVFKQLALERWAEAYDLHRRALRNRSQVAFHSLRIGIKRFRYIVENFLPRQHAAWSSDLKELQDVLGDIHDLDVLWATATRGNALLGEEARKRWHGIIREAREQKLARYHERMVGPNSRWQVWRAELPRGDEIQAAAMARFKLWASFLDPDFRHSERVAALAAQLFDGLARLDRVPTRVDLNLRSILQLAALTHDVGRARTEQGHHKASYRLLRRLKPPMGWTVLDLQLAAVVARFHRGALPRSRHKALKDLPLERKKLTLHLAAILRLANAFDFGREGQVERLSVEEKGGILLISAAGYAPWSSAAEPVARARHLLELVLRKPILVRPLPPASRTGVRRHVLEPSKPRA